MAPKKPSLLSPDWREHPSELVSLIPVYGAAREAIADYHDGDYVGMVGNGILAASDLVPAGALAKVGGKAALRAGTKLMNRGTLKQATREARRGVVKLEGSMSWDAVRRELTDTGAKPPGQHGHHWAIPQRDKSVAPGAKNQPWNIKVLDPETHGRLEGRYKGKPRYNAAQFIWYGSPDWAKAAVVSTAGRAAPRPMERRDD